MNISIHEAGHLSVAVGGDPEEMRMRLGRRWIIAGIALILLASAWLSISIMDRTYSGTALYTDTGVVNVSPTHFNFVEQPGRVTLSILRGEKSGIITSAHPSFERLDLDLPLPGAGKRIELPSDGVRVVFNSLFYGRVRWNLGDRGVRGYVQFEDVSDRKIFADYCLTVSGYSEQLQPAYRNREFLFQGKMTFRSQPRPEGSSPGRVWTQP